MADKIENEEISSDINNGEPHPDEIENHLSEQIPANYATGTLSITSKPEAVLEPIGSNFDSQNEPIELESSNEMPDDNNPNIVLEEQFDNYMRIAQKLMKTLKRPKDIEICLHLFGKIESLNRSQNVKVKLHNNNFFRYFLRILKWTSENQPLHLYRQWYKLDEDESLRETTKWLNEKKSYTASKTYKDGTTVNYVAISRDSSTGWQEGGFKILLEKAKCGRL
ncbi:uncharacterized protein LOC142223975 [Haematobia irritans]|uniref:uncharacterized protein LOC142223975 n=1 Tax=Haematobia irritans TaxID=7368 RepID=UPI003F500160